VTELWNALERLEDGNKWTKFTAYHDDARCILGAIGNSMDGDYMTAAKKAEKDVAAVAAVIRDQFPDRLKGHEVTSVSICRVFNDNLLTTWDDVRTVLEKAAISRDEVAPQQTTTP
jgi:hypothetical protein